MTRYFRLIHNNQTIGRFAGKTPRQAASKAFTCMIRDMKQNDNFKCDQSYNFVIIECTRGSKHRHKQFCYTGQREKLNCPRQVCIGSGSNKRIIVYNYLNRIKSDKKQYVNPNNIALSQ